MSVAEGVVNTQLLFFAQSAPVNVLLCSEPSSMQLVFAPLTYGSLNQMEISNKSTAAFVQQIQSNLHVWQKDAVLACT